MDWNRFYGEKCVVEEMKLNGKTYITKKQLLAELEDLILDLELRNFRDIQDDLEDLDSNNIDEILDLMEDVKRDLSALFDDSKYNSIHGLNDEINHMRFNPDDVPIALYKFGAYGIKSKATSDEVKRYGFNASLSSLNKRIQKYNNH